MMFLLSTPCFSQDERPDPTGTAKLVTINALVGGFAGGVANASGGRSFWTGFIKGAGGGIVVFAGKKIIAEQGALASWTGRQVAAIGSSQVRNAGAGRPILDEIVLPVGPARVYLKTGDSVRIRAKIDLTAAAGAIVMSRRQGASFDPAASFTHGAIIFRAPWPSDNSAGAIRLGVIRISEVPDLGGASAIAKSSVIAHELIHATQYDFINIALSSPFEEWALKRIGVGQIHRYVEFSSLSYLWTGLNGILEKNERPWEREAISLAPGY